MALEKVSLDGNECEELMKDGIAFKNNWDRMDEVFFRDGIKWNWIDVW